MTNFAVCGNDSISTEVLTMEKSSVRVNPQASLCELSWLGGIIDGEGCITIDKKSSKIMNQQCVSPTVVITNTDSVLINKVKEILGKSGIGFYANVHLPKNRWKEKTDIVISGYKRMNTFISFILPYLVAKKERALLVKELCEERLTRKFKSYTDREKEICVKIWKLNGRNTNPPWKIHTKAPQTTRRASYPLQVADGDIVGA